MIPNGRSAEISIANDGNIPATHIILTLQTPENITKVTIFSTENITKVTNSNSRTLQFSVPRLVQGSGSVVKLVTRLFANPNTPYPNYTIYATYDQGSIKTIFQKPLTLGEQFVVFWSRYGLAVSLIVGGIAFLFVPFMLTYTPLASYSNYLSFYFYTRPKRLIRRIVRRSPKLEFRRSDYVKRIDDRDFLVYYILTEMRSVRRTLGNDLTSADLFLNVWNPEFWTGDRNQVLKINMRRRRVIGNVSDYIYIDDFYTALTKRKSSIHADDIYTHNKECLQLVEIALKNIDWTKYQF